MIVHHTYTAKMAIRIRNAAAIMTTIIRIMTISPASKPSVASTSASVHHSIITL